MQSRVKVTMLAGGIGGSRLAVGFNAIAEVALTVIVNVGDDELVHGLHVSPDLDTMVYTLAGIEGSQGWGRAGETWRAMEELGHLGADTSFRLGDTDLATNLYRTARLAAGATLSEVTASIAARHQLAARIIPASDDPVRTQILTVDGELLDFQTYFVRRQHRDRVADVRYRMIEAAAAAPGVIDALLHSDLVVLAPSNPVLSILPILGIPEVGSAIEKLDRLVAISPLVGGKAVKGPTVEVMTAMGFEAGHQGVLAAYGNAVTHLVADTAFTADISVLCTDTRIAERTRARQLAEEVLNWAL